MMRYFILGTLLISIVGCVSPNVTTKVSPASIIDELVLEPVDPPDNSPPYIDHIAGVPFGSPPVNPPPFFHHKEVFIEGQYLYAAVDPNRYPNKVGNTYSVYVVEHKTHSQWDTDPSLVDVTGDVETRTLTDDSLEKNYTMVWADMSLPTMSHIWHKSYDIVFDFGNDGNYDKDVDILDRIGVLERSGAEETGGFTLLKDPASAGDFPVSIHEYNIGRDLIGRLYYPAVSDGRRQPVNNDLPIYPLIIIAHGRPEDPKPDSYRGYEYLGRHLASRGFIVASISLYALKDVTEPRARAEKILEHVQALLPPDQPVFVDPGIGSTVLGTIRSRMDPNRVGLLGHSLGGQGVVAAQEVFSGDPNPSYAIKAVATFAPADANSNEGDYFTLAPTLPFLLIYGTYDGNFTSGRPLHFFERASRPRHMITIYGANHNYFNYNWPDEVPWLTSGKITRSQQESLAKTFITAFFSNYLHDQQAYGELFSGHTVPPSVSAVPTTILYTDQPKRLNAILTIDDFENDLPGTNSLGKSNWSSQTTDFAEELLPPSFGIQPCELWACKNNGLRVAWESTRAAFTTFEIGSRNVLFYDFLNFRVAQYFREEDNLNHADWPQDLSVMISDDLGHYSPPVWVKLFAQIPFTDIPDPENTGRFGFPPKSIMQTVRIPLRAFTANGLHLDLRRVNQVYFIFDKQDSGELIFDDIEFLGVDMSEPDPAPKVFY